MGRVVKSQLLESSAYQRAKIKPVIDYDLLEEVFVIKKTGNNELIQLLEDVK